MRKLRTCCGAANNRFCTWVEHLRLKFASVRMKSVLPPALVGHPRLKFASPRMKEMLPASLATLSNHCVLLLPFFALVGLSSPIKVCLFEDEGDVQNPIAFTFPIEISFQINVNRIVHYTIFIYCT